MGMKAGQARADQLTGWFAGLCFLGVAAGAQALSMGECQQDPFYACCDCQFQTLKGQDEDYHCASLKAQCTAYSNTLFKMGLTYKERHSISLRQTVSCNHSAFDYCQTATTLLNLDNEFGASSFGCILITDDLRFVFFSLKLSQALFPDYSPPGLNGYGQLVSNPESYPVRINPGQVMAGLPWVLFTLNQTDLPYKSGYYLDYRVTGYSQAGWNLNSTWVNSTDGSSQFLAGPLALGQGIEIRLAGNGCPRLAYVTRSELLQQVGLDRNLPGVQFRWVMSYWPDVLGSVSATTAGQQPLDTGCQSLDDGRYHCTIDLSNAQPLSWLLIRAGQLPDAETLNYTGLSPLWQIPEAGWAWICNSQTLRLVWQAPPVMPVGYQVDRLCQNNDSNTTLVGSSTYMETTEVNRKDYQDCRFRILPVYGEVAYDGLGIDMVIAPQAGYSASMGTLELTMTESLKTTAIDYSASAFTRTLSRVTTTPAPTITSGIRPASPDDSIETTRLTSGQQIALAVVVSVFVLVTGIMVAKTVCRSRKQK